MKSLFISSLIVSLLAAVAPKLHAATNESSVFGEFGSAIGALTLYLRFSEKINYQCDMNLSTGKDDIDNLLQEKIGVSLIHVKNVFGASGQAHTEFHANHLIEGIENYIGCDEEELSALQRHLMLTIYQPNFEKIMRIEDAERLKTFINDYLKH